MNLRCYPTRPIHSEGHREKELRILFRKTTNLSKPLWSPRGHRVSKHGVMWGVGLVSSVHFGAFEAHNWTGSWFSGVSSDLDLESQHLNDTWHIWAISTYAHSHIDKQHMSTTLTLHIHWNRPAGVAHVSEAVTPFRNQNRPLLSIYSQGDFMNGWTVCLQSLPSHQFKVHHF